MAVLTLLLYYLSSADNAVIGCKEVWGRWQIISTKTRL